MIKRILALSLLVLIVFAFNAEAATKGRAVQQRSGVLGVDYTVTLTDGSTGDTAEIDANGSIQTKEFTKSVVTNMGDQADACSGAAVVYAVQISSTSSASAGDYIILDDSATVVTAHGAENYKLEVTISAAGETKEIVIPGGVSFTTGVSIDATDNDIYSTIVYSSY